LLERARLLLDRDRLLAARFRLRLRDGTFCPFSRASLRPMAIACLRLFTVRPERPLFNDPFLRRRIADSTVFCAPLPYLAMSFPPKGAQVCKACARAIASRAQEKIIALACGACRG